MSKWFNRPGNEIWSEGFDGNEETPMCNALSKPISDMIVREHNAHAELVLCLKAVLKITCGECRGEKPGKCAADPLACALSAQARAAIEAAEGRLQ